MFHTGLYAVVGALGSLTCEGGKATLDCGSQQIKVISANYGHTDKHTCAAGRPPNQVTKTDCVLPKTLSVMSERCDGRTSCSLYATNSVFSDPCRGTFKYLQAQYICLPVKTPPTPPVTTPTTTTPTTPAITTTTPTTPPTTTTATTPTTTPTTTTPSTTTTATTPPDEATAAAPTLPGPILICGQSQIQIGLNLPNGSSGHLADPQCSSFTERDGTVWYQVDRQADTCGNILTTNTTHAIYSNSLFIYHANNTGLPKVFTFCCVYPLNINTSLDVPIRPHLNVTDCKVGVGSSANGSMSLFKNSNYTEPYPAGPVTLPVGSALYVGVSVAEKDPSFVVVLDDCYATRSSRSDDPMRHFLIQNKCPKNQREVRLVESGSSLQARFSAHLFVFHGDYKDMYLHCSLHLCDQRASSCSPVCSGRRRRSVSTPLNPITIGPITRENMEE